MEENNTGNSQNIDSNLLNSEESFPSNSNNSIVHSLSQEAQETCQDQRYNLLNTINETLIKAKEICQNFSGADTTFVTSQENCSKPSCDFLNETSVQSQEICQNLKTNTTVVTDSREIQQECVENDIDWETFKEVTIQSIDLNVASCSTGHPRPPLPIMTISSVENLTKNNNKTTSRLPFIIIQSPTGTHSPITKQPWRSFSGLTLPKSPMSLIRTLPNQPQSLFLQALSKLNDSSINLAVVNYMRRLADEAVSQATGNVDATTEEKSPELTPPDSLTSAPPSYSFVLRQSAARRRPRLMGTFIPSPSFVQHTPPPNYAAAFDIYVDNSLPPQPTRVYSFGFTAMPVVCPECGYDGLTATTSKITLCTHLCALILCLFCCWLCAPLPYVMRSCKDVYHYCRNCRNYLGMYSPSNPESTYPV